MTIQVDEDVRLLKNEKFRRLLQARLAGQTAQNAMFYALLILLVQESGSSVHSTLLVVALTLPSIVLGIPGGTVADLLPRRFTLTLGYASRAAIAAALFYYSSDLVYIYLLVLAHSTVGQLFGPAEAATIPAVVRRDQLSAANSLMMLALGLAQIVGMVVMAPLVIKVFSPDAVFLVCAVLFLVATYIVALLASGFTRAQDERPPRIGFMEATREGFRILRSDRHTYLAMVYLTASTALGRMLVVLLPKYTRDVLEIAPEDTVFVAAPAAIGAGIGLILVPFAARLLGAWRLVLFGFILYVVGLIALGFVVLVRDFIVQNFDLGVSFVENDVGISSLITVTMIIAVPVGFANTIVAVAARVVMNEQAPPEAQGRVYAVQTAIADALALVPLLCVGIIADLAGARATLLTAALAALALSMYLTFSRRFGPAGDLQDTDQPAVGPEQGQVTQPG
jgi:MFS family permease